MLVDSVAQVAGVLPELVELRRLLHQYAELSDKEARTAIIVGDYLHRYAPDRLVKGLAGHGLAAVYDGDAPGPTVMFRCELDALPIREANRFRHRSKTRNVAHKCGHDGHMAMVAGLAPLLHRQRPARGRVVLLFQPAEELGTGAERVVDDPAFADLRPDWVFAVHNLPGYPTGEIFLRDGSITAASKGLVVKLTGATSHAAYPEDGRNPALCMAEIVQQLDRLGQEREAFADYVLLTVVHARLGRVDFGTTPGEAEVMATLRAYRNEDMAELTRLATKIVEEAAWNHRLQCEIAWRDEFPASVNHDEAVQCVEAAAETLGMACRRMPAPVRWSEDFSYFIQRYPGALFLIGSGEHHPQLHASDFDFPDAILPVGLSVYAELVRRILT